MLHESMETTKKMQYILNMSPVLNKDAMFSDGTEYYRTPVEPNTTEHRQNPRRAIRLRSVSGHSVIMWTMSVLCMMENIWK